MPSVVETAVEAEEAIVGVVGLAALGIAAVIGFKLYEFFNDPKNEDKKKGLEALFFGGLVGLGVEKGVEAVKSLDEKIDRFALNDIGRESGGDNAVQWMLYFGGPLYNDGFASFHYRILAENAQFMARAHGEPRAYLDKMPQAEKDKIYRGGVPSPFWIRQHLADLPFSKDLSGWFGSDAAHLKNTVWTDYDRLAGWLSNWSGTKEADQVRAKGLIKSDKDKLTAMLNAGKPVAPVEQPLLADRVLQVSNLVKQFHVPL
jgi:hypothetical protein